MNLTKLGQSLFSKTYKVKLSSDEVLSPSELIFILQLI